MVLLTYLSSSKSILLISGLILSADTELVNLSNSTKSSEMNISFAFSGPMIWNKKKTKEN